MDDEQTVGKGKAGRRGKRSEKPISLRELGHRVKVVELQARELDAKVRINALKAQLAGARRSRKGRKDQQD